MKETRFLPTICRSVLFPDNLSAFGGGVGGWLSGSSSCVHLGASDIRLTAGTGCGRGNGRKNGRCDCRPEKRGRLAGCPLVREEKKNRLVLSVFAREVEFVEDDDENMKSNAIFLDGYICKPPVYRKTPLGREIADLLIAVNRPYGKSDYIPCICWGRNARYASAFEVGGHVLLWGRIQSREYIKKLNDD